MRGWIALMGLNLQGDFAEFTHWHEHPNPEWIKDATTRALDDGWCNLRLYKVIPYTLKSEVKQ